MIKNLWVVVCVMRRKNNPDNILVATTFDIGDIEAVEKAFYARCSVENHDYYVDLVKAQKFSRNQLFTVLENLTYSQSEFDFIHMTINENLEK